jgi:hypothetical protein
MSQRDDPAVRDDDAYFADLAEQVGAADFDLGPEATAVAGTGDTPGRAYLAPFLSTAPAAVTR